MKKEVRRILVVLTTLVPLVLGIFPVFAAGNVEVTATVTPEQIAVALYGGAPSSVNYGTLPYGAVDRAPQNDPYIELVNNGTIREDFHIRGDDATTTVGSTWTLSNSPGHDLYVHKFGRGQTPTEYFPLTKLATDNMIHGAAGVAVSSREGFKLRLSMPASASVQNSNPYATTVTVVATAYGG